MTTNLANSSPYSRSHSKSLNVVAWVLQVLIAVAFIAAGTAKLAGAQPMAEVFDKIGIGQWFRLLTGALELLGAVGLLIPRTAFYASIALSIIMVGAAISHLTILGGTPAPAIILLGLSAIVAYLRRPHRRAGYLGE